MECSNIVTWEVRNSPILFGKTLELLCKISDQDKLCTRNLQQWYGSREDVLLCQNGECRNGEKYTVQKNENCSYSLLIHNVSISDVDISYSCAYGIYEMKKKLLTKDYEFLQLPSTNSVITSFTINDSIIDIMIQVDGIYPEPTCVFLLNDRDLSRIADVSSNVTENNIFYTYKMRIVYTVGKMDCGSLLLVRCFIGKYVMTNFTKELDECSDFNSNSVSGNYSISVVWKIVLPAVVGICVLICVLLKLKKIYNRRRSGGITFPPYTELQRKHTTSEPASCQSNFTDKAAIETTV